MVNIKKQLVSQEVVNKRSYGKGNKIKSITPHQTGNTNPGADAQAHANIQSNLNPRQASWHYSVDDEVIIQSFEDDIMCWAAGDGKGPGNTESIHIEMCVNSDGDYEKTLNNGAAIVKLLMDKHGLDISSVKQHHDWSGKNCPVQLRAGYKGISWQDFLNKVEGVQEQENFGSGNTSTNTKPSTTSPKNTNSIVDYLNSKGVDSSYTNRAKLAKEYGIKDYKGTAPQNIKLLELIKKGKPASTKAKKEYVTLPASAKTWRTYKLNVAPVTKNSDWSLTPAAFGGLTYEILDKPQANVVTIKTSRGKRNIYVGADTSAKIYKK